MRRLNALTNERKIKFQSDPNAQRKILIRLWSKDNRIIRAVDVFIVESDIFQQLTDLLIELES